MFLEYCHDGDLKEYLKKKEGKINKFSLNSFLFPLQQKKKYNALNKLF